MVQGGMEWRRIGLAVPQTVRTATDDYFNDQDTISQWADEWIEPELEGFVKTRVLFKSWKQWCDDRNLSAGTETAFADTLKDRGYEQKRTNSSRGFKGIALKVNDVAEPRIAFE
jgi:putative DNA primase/helicase